MQIGYITLGLVRVEMKKRVKKIRGTTVSYTHLTLPTKRIV